MNNVRTQDWRRTPRPPNDLYVGFYSISRTRLNLEHKIYMALYSLETSQRPHDPPRQVWRARCTIPADLVSLRSEPRTPPHESVLTSTLHASS
jgi:hypothetical protein